jgi:hypothetical protein
MNPIGLIYLSTGAVLVSRFAVDADTGEVAVDRPMVIQVTRAPNGQVTNVALEPYGSLGILPPLKDVSFHPSEVMHVAASPAQLDADYIKATSGIQIAH